MAAECEPSGDRGAVLRGPPDYPPAQTLVPGAGVEGGAAPRIPLIAADYGRAHGRSALPRSLDKTH